MRLLLVALLTASAALAVDAAREAAKARPRRIIFNDDGGETRVPTEPLPKPTDFLPFRIGPLQGTQVDTVAFDTTSGTFNRPAHRTAVAEMFLVREGRYQHNILPDLLRQDTDPLQVVVEHCRKTGQEVFWTLRMNDTHDASNPLLIPQLKRDHPDWLMGTKDHPPSRGTWSAVDYARPEIRHLARGLIAETAARYDLDGVALDFWRHPIYFRSTAAGQPATEDERELMTRLLRDIRADLEAIGRRRGRPILLAIKTPDSIGYCHEVGLDLARWLAEDLVDLYVPGGYFQLNPWAESVTLAHRHGAKIYACLSESRVRDADAAKERASLESLRARALAAWTAGVDGIEMFNHFDPKSPLWRELGDPALLRRLPKTYFASVQGASNSRGYYTAGAHFTLSKLTPDAPDKIAAGASVTHEFYLGDDLRATAGLHATLGIRVASTAGKLPTIQWDGIALPVAASTAQMFVASLENDRVTPGVHRVTITAADALRLDDLLIRIEPQ